MRKGHPPYEQMAINPKSQPVRLEKHGNMFDSKTTRHMGQNKCLKCGKILVEVHDSKYCKECAEKIIPAEKGSNHTRYREISDFSPLIADLNGNSPTTRAYALEFLCKIKDERAVKILINALKNKDSNIRWKVAKYLGNIRNKNAVEALIAALKDSDFIVRNNAAWSLGEIGDKHAIEPLNLALQDENKYVKNSAMEAIDKIKYIMVKNSQNQ